MPSARNVKAKTNPMIRALPLIGLLLICARPAAAEVPAVVTDIAPVQSLVAQVMGNLGSPEMLVAPGAEPHSYQLRPSQMAALGRADLVIWIGPEMSPWLERAMQSASQADDVRLLALEGTKLRHFGGEGGGADPHAWLDPDNAQLWLTAISAALSRHDPDHTDQYADNAATAAKEIRAADSTMRATLASARRPFITSHAAYGYFADHYGLTIAASIEDGDAAEPGAAHISDLSALIAAGQVACVFPEAGHDPARAQELAAGSAVRLGPPLDPEGVAHEPGAGMYLSLMLTLAQSVADCQAGH